MQADRVNHIFHLNYYFEDVIERYNFDRHLRLILFDAVERIENRLITKMIYHLSVYYGSTWYLSSNLFLESFSGAAIDVVLRYFFFNNRGLFLKGLSFDLGMIYKTDGFMPEELYLE